MSEVSKTPILVCFTFVCIKMYVKNFSKWNVPLHKHKQQKLLSIRVTIVPNITSRSDIVSLIKRNKKYETCYNNSALWKIITIIWIETIVDVK